MSVHHTTLSPSAHATETSQREIEALRRVAIDLIATSRARAIRIALFGQMIQRLALCSDTTIATPEQCIAELQAQVKVMARTCRVVRGDDPDDAIAAPLLRWIKQQADASPDILQTLDTLHTLSSNVLERGQAAFEKQPGAAQKLDAALEAHYKFGRGPFHSSVTAFCDSLWLSLDDLRDADLLRTKKASAAITTALSRLDRIGRHVRLVSINAAVEASRAGDAGKGLTIIAMEFKSLSEEIQKLAATAKEDIDSLA